MEPASKKTKLTDHFRVALRPRDLNVTNLNHNNNNIGLNSNNNNNNNSKRHINLNQQTRPALVIQNHNNQSQRQSEVRRRTKEINQLRENLLEEQQHLQKQQQQLERQPLKRGPLSPQKVEVITLDDDDDETEIDEQEEEDDGKSTCSTVISASTEIYSQSLKVDQREQIHNFEETVLDNVFWEPHYACDSFEYDRKQELKFRIDRRHLTIPPARRADLVDWLVAIQVRYCLDHEPLYMAVKMADQYLMRKRDSDFGDFTLLYMTTMFMSAKFDERQSCITIPLMIKQARTKFGLKYTRRQIISLEVDLLTTLNFNIRFPLSYGFLRRFARCTRSDMQTINLARYILESSLMDYDMIEILESEIAAGSLLLAHEMLQHTNVWDATARHYTGYEEQQLFPLISRLNRMLLKSSRRKTSIKKKYSHELFMEVANIQPMFTKMDFASIFC